MRFLKIIINFYVSSNLYFMFNSVKYEMFNTSPT